MFDQRLFVLAYNSKEWNTVAYLMGALEGAYIEGSIRSSGYLYNRLIKRLPKEALLIMKKRAVFGTKVIDFWIDSINKGVDFKKKSIHLQDGVIDF